MFRINLNADVGEGIGDDAALLSLVASGNIACGGHAGDRETMQRTLLAARASGAGIGAHPGFEDREGFGRRELSMCVTALETLVSRQVGALIEIAARNGLTVDHVKPHGALYNMAARDLSYAMAIGRAIRQLNPGLIFVGQSGSAMQHAAFLLELSFAREAFPDRGYGDDGHLLPRGAAGAVISDPQVVAARAVGMARDGEITTASGGRVRLAVDTLCIHGDAPGALAIARAVRDALLASGVEIVPLARSGASG